MVVDVSHEATGITRRIAVFLCVAPQSRSKLTLVLEIDARCFLCPGVILGCTDGLVLALATRGRHGDIGLLLFKRWLCETLLLFKEYSSRNGDRSTMNEKPIHFGNGA